MIIIVPGAQKVAVIVPVLAKVVQVQHVQVVVHHPLDILSVPKSLVVVATVSMHILAGQEKSVNGIHQKVVIVLMVHGLVVHRLVAQFPILLVLTSLLQLNMGVIQVNLFQMDIHVMYSVNQDMLEVVQQAMCVQMDN